MSTAIEPSIQFVATSIPTEDAYYIHFSDRHKDPTCYVLIQGEPHSFNVSLRIPRVGDLRESMGLKTCRLEPGLVLIQLESSLFHKIEGSGQVRITFDEKEHNITEIKRQLVEIIGDARLINNGQSHGWQETASPAPAV
jgi:hypothetical protein